VDECQAKGAAPQVRAGGPFRDGARRTAGKRLLGVRPRFESAQLVIQWKVDYNKVSARIVGCRQPSGCSTPDDLAATPPNAPGTCVRHAEALVTRGDEREFGVRERLEASWRSLRRLPGCQLSEMNEGSASSALALGRFSGCMVLE